MNLRAVIQEHASAYYNMKPRFRDQKCWLKNDALCLRASIQDALRKTSPKIEMDCGYYLLNQRSYNNLQRLELSLRYTFNAQQSKY